MTGTTDHYITVLTFTYPHELAVIRGRLEAEGIECLVKDELTVQVHPFYSNAVGGIKLQVKNTDLELAIAILRESGYIKNNSIPPSKFRLALGQFTLKLPLLNRLQLELRLIIMAALVLAVLVTGIYLATLPSTYTRLTQNNWCMDKVVYEKERYFPQTEKILILSGPGFCQESIIFQKKGMVKLPGFKSQEVHARWKLRKGLIEISGADMFGFVYNGVYKPEFLPEKLILTSAKTILHCSVPK